MKIQSSDVLLSGRHQSVQQHTKSESLKAWVGNQRPDFEGRGQNAVRDNVALSEQAKAAAQADTGKAASSEAVDPEKAFENDPRAMLIRMMVEAFTGRKIHFTAMENIDTGADAQPVADPNQAATSAPSQAQQAPPPPPSAGFGVEYDYHESYHEAESTNFSAQGVVKTADGKEINFDLQLSMERSYSREVNISVRQGDAARQKKDPLVINFGGTAAQLTSTKFSFDIDADGKTEKLSFVAPNSGFIALDKNNDGKINNGSELFGAKSGDGFKELAAYDQDKNGWIDENDAVFAQLKVWSKDAQGKDSLTGLKQSGVGALYLGAAATPFEIKTGSNDSLGAVRASGIYLNENGSAGTLQQIDLTV
ncbi:MAG: hypothetical protein WC091_05700 [Sulfuricellaceae bacterium]